MLCSLELTLALTELLLKLAYSLIPLLNLVQSRGLLHPELFDLRPGPPPLASNLEQVGRAASARRYGRGGLDDCEDLRVDLNVEILTLGQLLVSLVHLLFDKVCDRTANDRVADVEDPLSYHMHLSQTYSAKRTPKGTYLSGQHGDIAVIWEVVRQL